MQRRSPNEIFFWGEGQPAEAAWDSSVSMKQIHRKLCHLFYLRLTYFIYFLFWPLGYQTGSFMTPTMVYVRLWRTARAKASFRWILEYDHLISVNKVGHEQKLQSVWRWIKITCKQWPVLIWLRRSGSVWWQVRVEMCVCLSDSVTMQWPKI